LALISDGAFVNADFISERAIGLLRALPNRFRSALPRRHVGHAAATGRLAGDTACAANELGETPWMSKEMRTSSSGAANRERWKLFERAGR
jgi:hypothetical protein